MRTNRNRRMTAKNRNTLLRRSLANRNRRRMVTKSRSDRIWVVDENVEVVRAVAEVARTRKGRASLAAAVKAMEESAWTGREVRMTGPDIPAVRHDQDRPFVFPSPWTGDRRKTVLASDLLSTIRFADPARPVLGRSAGGEVVSATLDGHLLSIGGTSSGQTEIARNILGQGLKNGVAATVIAHKPFLKHRVAYHSDALCDMESLLIERESALATGSREEFVPYYVVIDRDIQTFGHKDVDRVKALINAERETGIRVIAVGQSHGSVRTLDAHPGQFSTVLLATWNELTWRRFLPSARIPKLDIAPRGRVYALTADNPYGVEVQCAYWVPADLDAYLNSDVWGNR